MITATRRVERGVEDEAELRRQRLGVGEGVIVVARRLALAPPVGLVVAHQHVAGHVEERDAAAGAARQVERRAEHDAAAARLEPAPVEQDHRQVLDELGRVDDADGRRRLGGAIDALDARGEGADGV